jgi:hypothetical protein
MEVEREAGDGKKNLEAMKAEVDKYRRRVDECGRIADKEREGEAAVCQEARWNEILNDELQTSIMIRQPCVESVGISHR